MFKTKCQMLHGLLSRSRFQSALLGNSNHSVMYTPAVYHMCTTLISAVCRDIFCRPQRCSDAFASRKALLKRFDLQFYFPAAVWSHQTYSCPQTNGAGSLWSSSYVSYIRRFCFTVLDLYVAADKQGRSTTHKYRSHTLSCWNTLTLRPWLAE